MEQLYNENLTLSSSEGVAMYQQYNAQQQFISEKELISHRFFVPGEQWIAFFITILVGILTRRWQKARQQGQQMKRNQSGIIQIARDSSAASLATLKQVSSSASFARLSEAVRSLKCFQTVVATISAPEFFVRSDLVQKLSLAELSTIISYASECNRMGFDNVAFLATLPPHVKEVIAAVDTAVLRSRGVNVRLSQIAAAGSRDFDALYFCAAMRLLVEWRSIKIVPEEYKAYAVGMNVAKRDFVQNSAKTEDAVHRWIEHEITSGKEEVSSPTIRQILHFEAINNVHTRLPKLKDKTAAIGIVWMSRQLQFQSQIFANLTKVPTTYGSAMEAVRAAYKTVFNNYHGWAIQQIFNYAFNGAPPATVLFQLMNPNIMEKLKDCGPDADTVMVDYPAVPASIESSFTDDDDDDDMVTCGSRSSSKEEGFSMIKLGHEIKGNWEKFAGNVERGWSNFVGNIVLQGRNKKKRDRALSQDTSQSDDAYSDLGGSDESTNVQNRPSPRSFSVPAFVLNEDALQQYAEKETTKTAHMQIDQYLTIMHPLLKELTSTINEFNMNDPSRV
jgi:hypothetical protein